MIPFINKSYISRKFYYISIITEPMSKIRLFAFSITFLSLMAFFPDDNADFPKITGTTLDGKNISLPLDAHGKFALIGVLRTMKAEQSMVSWIVPVYESIAGNSLYQAKMYFIPMTGGIEGVSVETVRRKLRESMDSSMYKYVLLYTGPIKEYVKSLKMSDPDLPYIFVVDPRGKITYTESGKYTEKKMENITDKLAE